MPAKSNKRFEILRRRRQIAELYVQRHSQALIAERLGISQATVSADIHRIRREWRVSTLRDFDAACDLELQQLDRVEREAWELFARSQKPAQSAVIDGNGNGGATRKSLKNRDGDVRVLDTILKVGAARRALLGLDAPTRIEPVITVAFTPEQRRIHMEAILDEQCSRSPTEENSPHGPQTIETSAYPVAGRGAFEAEPPGAEAEVGP